MVAALACAGLLVALASTLDDSVGRLTGSNSVPASAAVATVEPKQVLCQKEAIVPAGTRMLTLGASAASATTPALDVTVKTARGERVTRGHLPGGYGAVGSVNIPVESVNDTVGDATVCIRNAGRAPLMLYGTVTPTPSQLFVDGRQLNGLLTVLWYGGAESWLAHVPEIMHHVDVGGTQIAGGSTLWLVLGLVLAASALALYLTLRPERE